MIYKIIHSLLAACFHSSVGQGSAQQHGQIPDLGEE